MKITIKWRYPNEEEIHSHTFYGIDPKTVGIHYGILGFGTGDPMKSWTFQISYVVEMEMEEE